MDFVLLSLMTQKPNIATYWFIPQIAADGTKDNSWPFRTGIPSISFKNRIDMRTLYYKCVMQSHTYVCTCVAILSGHSTLRSVM